MNHKLRTARLAGLAFALSISTAPPGVMAADFTRGDVDGGGSFQITDPIRALGYLFLGSPTVLGCADAADANDDGALNITDAVFSLAFLFSGGPAPPAPFPACGADLTADGLSCDAFDACTPDLPARMVSTSPLHGESGVALARETVLRFDRPIDPATVTAEAIRASLGGQTLPARLHVSPAADTVTIFYRRRLPASSRVRVRIDGELLRDAAGGAVDVEPDGIAGGVAFVDFDTLALATFPGTRVCGRVYASELAPGDNGASINVPLEGAEIAVDGDPSRGAVTDALGNFCLDPAPAGRFAVLINGQAAVKPVPPAGAYYPFVGKTWESIPGAETSVGDVFLPLIPAGTLQEISPAAETVVTFAPGVLAAHPELEGVHLRVPPGSPFFEDGSRGARVGIAPVPPDRLPQALPEGLEFPIVITIQTDGASNFDTPVPACFPNLPDPALGRPLVPGEKSWLYSFNHDTGRFEGVGSMTVSADGRLVCTDPGTGIPAPGWHAPGPPPWEPPPPPPPECDTPTDEGGGGDGGGGATTTRDCLKKPNRRACRHCCKDNYDACWGGAGSEEQFVNCYDVWKACREACKIRFPGGRGGGGGLDEDNDGLDEIDPRDAALQDLLLEMDALRYPFAIQGLPVPPAVEGELAALEAQADQVAGEPYEAYRDRVVAEAEAAEQGDWRGNAPSYGVRYAARVVRDGQESWLRGETGPGAQYQLFVPRGASVERVELHDARAGAWGAAFPWRTEDRQFRLHRAGFVADSSALRDFDEDGLPDVVERVYATSPSDPDSDGDGIRDGAEVDQGLDPLGGRPAVTGVIGTAPTPGTAIDVAAANDLVVVALGGAGVAAYNVFQGMNPTLVALVDTPGTATGVAISGRRVCAADYSSGLAVIDLSDPPSARVVHQVELGGLARCVAAAGDAAYVGLAPGEIVRVDLEVGAVLDRTALPAAVEDVALEGEVLYAVTRDRVAAFSIAAGFPELLSEISSARDPELVAGRTRLFAGGGMVYASTRTGYDVFDARDPFILKLAGSRSTEVFGFKQVVLNGSGLAVAAVGPNSSGAAEQDVWLFDATDPRVTNQFLGLFPTPGIAHAVSIYNGLAYVADGDRGLQVINYRGPDSLGQPPSIALSTNFAGAGAEEEKLFRVSAAVTDDVQVRNVEFWIDGALAGVDGNYPFEHRLTAPSRAEKPGFTVRARATDTGGNAVWSEVLDVTLVPDATAPRVKRVEPANGTIVRAGLTAVAAFLSEPLRPDTVTPSSFTLSEAGPDLTPGTGDDVAIAARVRFNAAASSAVLEPAQPLAAGIYRATLAASVADLAGIPAEAPFSWSFEARAPVYWVLDGDGFWDNASAWSAGRAPADGDFVVIDRPAGSFTVTYRADRLLELSALECAESLVVTGTAPSLTVAASSSIGGDLTVAAAFGHVGGRGTLAIGGTFTWLSGTHTGPGKTVALGPVVLDGAIGLNAGRQLEIASTAVWRQGAISTSADSLIRVNAGAVLSIETDSRINGSGCLDLHGTLAKTGGAGATIVQATLNNWGRVRVDRGALDVASAVEGISQGEYEIAEGARLVFTAAHTLETGTTFGGGGVVEVVGGPLSVDGSVEVPRLTLSNLARIGGGGLLTITEILHWLTGGMDGTGSTVIGAGAALIAEGPGVKAVNRTLVNRGSVTWKGGSGFGIAPGIFLEGAFINTAGSTVTLEADGIAFTGKGLENAGAVVKSGGTGVTRIDARLISTGRIEVLSGTLVHTLDSVFAGDIAIARGAFWQLTGNHVLAGGLMAGGAGTALWTSGDVNVAGDVSIARLDLAGSRLIGAGALTVTGEWHWRSGSMVGEGSTIAGAGASLFIEGEADRSLLRRVENRGTALWNAGGRLFGNGAANPAATLHNAAGASLILDAPVCRLQAATLENAGSIEVRSGVLWLQQSKLVQSFGVLRLAGGGIETGDSPFDLRGGLLTGTGAITGSLINAARVEVGGSPGTLTVTGAYTQTGSGVLVVELGGLEPGDEFDQLAVGGAAALAGSLEVRVLGGYSPEAGDDFQIVASGSRTGTFAAVDGSGRGFAVSYSAAGAMATAQ